MFWATENAVAGKQRNKSSNVIENENGTFIILLLASKNYKYNTAAKQGVRTTERIKHKRHEIKQSMMFRTVRLCSVYV